MTNLVFPLMGLPNLISFIGPLPLIFLGFFNSPGKSIQNLSKFCGDGDHEQPGGRHGQGRSANRRRRPRRFVDRARSVQKTRRGFDPGEPEDVISDLRVAIAAGDRGHVPRDRMCGVSAAEFREGNFSD